MSGLTVLQWTTEARNLVVADDRYEIRRLDNMLQCAQDEAVNHFVEDSCWADDMPEFSGGKGTPQERRSALRTLWRAAEAEESADA